MHVAMHIDDDLLPGGIGIAISEPLAEASQVQANPPLLFSILQTSPGYICQPQCSQLCLCLSLCDSTIWETSPSVSPVRCYHNEPSQSQQQLCRTGCQCHTVLCHIAGTGDSCTQHCQQPEHQHRQARLRHRPVVIPPSDSSQAGSQKYF